MRKVFVFTFMANLALGVVSLFILPDTVAMHFGIHGEPNGWGPNYVNVLIMTGVELLLFLSVWFMGKVPSNLMNVPNKAYWMKPENLPLARARMEFFKLRIGSVFFMFLFIVGLMTLQANLARGGHLNMTIFWFVFVVVMLYTLSWVVVLRRAFRIPGEK
jgi:uncharacterized membrane protein